MIFIGGLQKSSTFIKISCSFFGSPLSGAILLLPFLFYNFPTSLPSLSSWINLIVLVIAYTAVAQLIYFRLIERVGATKATSVTFIIPIFGLVWENLFSNENIELQTVIATAIILFCTSLTIGLIKSKKSP